MRPGVQVPPGAPDFMQYSQKYSLVSFTNPLPIDFEFPMSEWPLHITLADVFAIDLENSGIISKLATFLADQPALRVQATQESKLGDAAVVLVEKSVELNSLHMHIIDLLEENGASFNTPEFNRTGFTPHTTIQDGDRPATGDIFTVSSLSLIDMFPGGDWQQRKVLHNFQLG